jgi:hypothetical protein
VGTVVTFDTKPCATAENVLPDFPVKSEVIVANEDSVQRFVGGFLTE